MFNFKANNKMKEKKKKKWVKNLFIWGEVFGKGALLTTKVTVVLFAIGEILNLVGDGIERKENKSNNKK